MIESEDYETAVSAFRAAELHWNDLEYSVESDVLFSVAQMNRGIAYWRLGQTKLASRELSKSFDRLTRLWNKSGNPGALTFSLRCLWNLANLRIEASNFGGALDDLEIFAKTFADTGMRRSSIDSVSNLNLIADTMDHVATRVVQAEEYGLLSRTITLATAYVQFYRTDNFVDEENGEYLLSFLLHMSAKAKCLMLYSLAPERDHDEADTTQEQIAIESEIITRCKVASYVNVGDGTWKSFSSLLALSSLRRARLVGAMEHEKARADLETCVTAIDQMTVQFGDALEPHWKDIRTDAVRMRDDLARMDRVIK